VLAGTVQAVDTDEAGCGWVELLVTLTVDGALKTDCTVRVALPVAAGDNPWTRHADNWKP
ncbi:MAG TPA: hypothetical protein VHP57_01675, partial [Acidimicrobiia bacterium]|nr:hypothetical protein [Acidimicrobiia bacterium]